jgi:hypothetical protein
VQRGQGPTLGLAQEPAAASGVRQGSTRCGHMLYYALRAMLDALHWQAQALPPRVVGRALWAHMPMQAPVKMPAASCVRRAQ